MGRRSRTQKLVIWLNGTPVGEWSYAPGRTTFAYFDEWLADPQGRPISLSLPFRPNNEAYRGDLVLNYFDNLLPDSALIRRRIAQRFQADDVDPFNLLAAVGRDCVGAIQLLPPDEAPANLFAITGKPLNDQTIAQIIRNTAGPTLPGLGVAHDDLRLSIAGAQEKTALLRHKNKWLLPTASTPTTHILKLPIGLVGNMQADMRTSVENEWLCSKIMGAYGLPVAQCDIGIFGDQKVLIVERFDRKFSDDKSWIARLPQEDFCQATGTSSLYRYQADGGPGVIRIMEILSGSELASLDRRNFFKIQILFWLLAATDGHAKNFSIFHLPGSQYRATPLYDILSAHPVLGAGKNQIAPQKAKLAMAVRATENYYRIVQIQRRHWGEMARQAGLGERVAETLIEEILAKTDEIVVAMHQMLPPQFPMDLAESILSGLQRQCKKLQMQKR
ncbi:serine/threonine-protein kinase HipA [Oxalobacteraceae bacterium GrIS 2.11]